LQVDSEGRKFGKSVGGAVWLSADKLSPYKFYQHLFAVTDADVIKFLKMLTFVGLEEIAAIEASMGQPGYVPNTAQRRLAEEVTRFVHGEEGLKQALNATMVRITGGEGEGWKRGHFQHKLAAIGLLVLCVLVIPERESTNCR
jgi:tyrosyl-tRNA synthetase